ncbi:MAG: sodium:solute symporter family protein [Verrucomicrobiota bacterium]
MTWIDYTVLIIYFGVMVAIGIWAMRRVKGQEDYFMGGRGFGKLLQTFAAFGAGTGAHEPVTVGSTSWKSGLSGVWAALMWLFVTPIYWFTGVWYRRMRHLTLGDWFVERYESKGLGAAYTGFAIVFYMFFLSTMLSAIAKFAAPLMGVDELFGQPLEVVLIPTIAVIVIIYGVLGGLTAAYWTDLIQGVFIILLSILLIPFGLWALVKEFGDPATMGVMDGFTIMHERVSSDYFGLFSGPRAGEFPPQYIFSLTFLVLVGIVVQPHFIATGGGSAKSEDEARIGLVTGNFLKRLCTVGWALTALIALALLAGNAEIAEDPDRVWGVAAREILGPLNIGLVGLMLACLLAAMMSSADAYMIVTSALVSRNVYGAYLDPNAPDKTLVTVARLTGLIIIIGACVVAIYFKDVFGQFKMAVEMPILFAAPFWVGMFWRRANRTAVWITVTFSTVFFFVLPMLIPAIPGVRESAVLSATSNHVTTTITREATAADVAKREAWEVAQVGEEPPAAVVGEPIQITLKSGGQSLFWAGGVEAVGEIEKTEIDRREAPNQTVVVERQTGAVKGKGWLRVDFLVYKMLGIDLSNASKATIETLRLPTRVLLPFLVLIIASYFTPRNTKEALDKYYVKMKTEVDPDPAADEANLRVSHDNPSRFDDRKIFKKGDLEFVVPRPKDIIGFVAAVIVCFLVIGLLIGLANIGAK